MQSIGKTITAATENMREDADSRAGLRHRRASFSSNVSGDASASDFSLVSNHLDAHTATTANDVSSAATVPHGHTKGACKYDSGIYPTCTG